MSNGVYGLMQGEPVAFHPAQAATVVEREDQFKLLVLGFALRAGQFLVGARDARLQCCDLRAAERVDLVDPFLLSALSPPAPCRC